jgi:hypothetical protein
MNTSTKTTSISAVFLAAILVAGSIAAAYPMMVIGAQAEQYYGMDRDRNSDKKQVSVSSLKCNNINVNVNGLELDVFPPFLGGGDIAADAAEANTGASSFEGNGGANGGSEINDFRFICINNNNNTLIGGGEPVPPTPPTPPTPVDECVLCFEEFEDTDLLLAAIAELGPGDLTGDLAEFLGIELDILLGLLDVITLEDLCEFLESLDLELNLGQLVLLVITIFGDDLEDPVFLADVVNLLVCLIFNGIIDIVPGEDIDELQTLLQQQLQQAAPTTTAPLSPPTTP